MSSRARSSLRSPVRAARGICFSAVIILSRTAAAQTTDVALGIEALARRDVRGAELAFRRGTTADNPLVRPAAWQWLGHVAWKFRGDTASAVQHLARALAEARDSSQVLLEMARLDGARGRHVEAVRAAFEAMRRSGDAERRGGAARVAADLMVDAAFALHAQHVGPRRLVAQVGESIVNELRDTLASRVARFHGRTSDAHALINVGALMGDTAAIRTGMRSYFALVDDAIRPNVDSLITADGRCNSPLFECAALMNYRAFESSVHREDMFGREAYGRFVHDTRAGMDYVYRAQLNGGARPGDVTRFLNGAFRSLWRGAAWKRETFIPAEVSREIAKRFGAVISVERRGGMEELYFSHRLGAYRTNGATVVILDGIVTSGVDQWLLDGTGGRAGWVSNDTIYERRTAFTETPFRALLALTDPQTIPGESFRITRDSIGDIDRAKRDSLGYFPGVAARVFRSGAQSLLDSVREPAVFTRAMYDALRSTSILLHESRHVRDAATSSGSAADDEFRAKIDEVAGARYPRLALTAILSPNIGDASPHGQANRRIMVGLARWIRRNGPTIQGYDVTTPALLQLPLLSDAQLRAAFESMRRP